MRCDLHVHTLHSGPPDLPALRHLSRECYSEPLAVYETAKRRGMDLVTITDHDTLDQGAHAFTTVPKATNRSELPGSVSCETGWISESGFDRPE